MRRILQIARRDYVATVQTKAFLFGLLVAPILFGGGFIGLTLMKQKPDLTTKRVVILDRTGVAADTVVRACAEKNAREVYDKEGRQVEARIEFEGVKANGADLSKQRLALSDRVRRGELMAFLEIGPAAIHPGEDTETSQVSYYTNAGGIDRMRYWFADAANEGLRRVRLAELGVNQSHFKDLLRSVQVERMGLVSKDEQTGEIREAHKKSEMESFGVPYAMVMLLGMIVLVGSSPLLTAVTQDKTHRVVEMLLGVATPFELMLGKVLAAIGVSLTSSAFYVIGGTMMLQGLGMLGLVPFSLLPWFYVYLIADVTMLCGFAAALGAACSTPQDAQSLAVVLIAPVIIPFFLLMPILQQPNGVLATVLSLFPLFTPLLMLLRQTLPGGVPAWQPWVGLIGVIACTLGMTWASARIFRVGILLQGKPPRVAELVRWAWRG